VVPAELPRGIVTALVGAPFFLRLGVVFSGGASSGEPGACCGAPMSLIVRSVRSSGRRSFFDAIEVNDPARAPH
jgi:hypothetical protein